MIQHEIEKEDELRKKEDGSVMVLWESPNSKINKEKEEEREKGR